MAEWKEQFERVKRSLNRIENRNEDLTPYHEDDFWHFFQDCYHLKDWIKNDSSIPKNIKGEYIDKNHKEGHKVEECINANTNLSMCADLANKSKHLKLKNNIRIDEKIQKRSITYHAPTVIITNSQGKEVYNSGPGKSTIEYFVQLSDGTHYKALEVAKKAVEA